MRPRRRWDDNIKIDLQEVRFVGRGAVVWLGILRERDHLWDPGVDGRIILRWIFLKWDLGAGVAVVWLGNLRESDHLGNPGVDGRIILR